MRLGIDASNVVVGGGLTHLCEILRHTDARDHGFSKVVVWCGRVGKNAITPQPWLEVVEIPELNGGLLTRALWQYRSLPKLAQESCDILFSPGGRISRGFKPVVTMFQNMLPFSPVERARYGFGKMWLRLRLLQTLQKNSFRDADGVIYLTDYARQTVMQAIDNRPKGMHTVIAHGINPDFYHEPRQAFFPDSYDESSPFNLLYVSTIDVYKHQWHVAEAVAALRAEGLPVSVTFAGTSYEPSRQRLSAAIKTLDPNGAFLHFPGAIPYTELGRHYANADAFVFASSCENLPIILLEAMAAGLPIACSEFPPMPSVLRDAGILFNPLKPSSIADAIRKLFLEPELRRKIAQKAYENAAAYSWQNCANETFKFLAAVCGAAGSNSGSNAKANQ